MEFKKEKRGHFLYYLFCPKKIFFNIFVLSQCIVHWIQFQNTHTFTYPKKKKNTSYTFVLVLKIDQSLQCILKKKCNIPVFVNMKLVFLLAVYANSLVDSFPYMLMITNLIEPRVRKLILKHLIGNIFSEFRNGFLDSYFFKLTLGSDCLELYFWTVAFETILTQWYNKNTSRSQTTTLNTILRIWCL